MKYLLTFLTSLMLLETHETLALSESKSNESNESMVKPHSALENQRRREQHLEMRAHVRKRQELDLIEKERKRRGSAANGMSDEEVLRLYWEEHKKMKDELKNRK